MLAPALRAEFGLTLAEVGIVLSSLWIGPTFTLLAWGLATDRLGERVVLAGGLGLSAVFVAAAALAEGIVGLTVLLTVAGAAGAAVNSASGRAVMGWFGPEERGLALGVRQTAIPLGGAIGAVVLPSIEDTAGVGGAFLFLAGLALAGAVAGGLVVRDVPGGELAGVRAVLGDARLWRLVVASGLFLPAQIAITGFVVLFLHDERGLSNTAAAGVLAGMQVLAVAARIGAGRWSDVVRSRVGPLRAVGVASALATFAVAALLEAPLWALVPAFVLAGAVSMGWNGLSFTAAAELAGRGRSGAAIGFQQTALAVIGLGVPAAFAAGAELSWALAFAVVAVFPLVGFVGLAPLRDR